MCRFAPNTPRSFVPADDGERYTERYANSYLFKLLYGLQFTLRISYLPSSLASMNLKAVQFTINLVFFRRRQMNIASELAASRELSMANICVSPSYALAQKRQRRHNYV